MNGRLYKDKQNKQNYLLNKMSVFVLCRKNALFFSIRTRAEFLIISSPNDFGSFH